MSNGWRALLFAAVLIPSVSFAQAAAPAKDKEAVTFNEIERGPYFGVNGGLNYLVTAPHASDNGGLGQHVGVEIGSDIGDRLSVAGFIDYFANKASANYVGESGGSASGDYSALTPGAVVRVNTVGFNDAQEVRRTWIYIRAGAGYAMFAPKQLLPNNDILVFAGPGVEYYTRLRHFSVALEVTGSFLLASGSVGIQVTPNLRYAF